jgi:hypothetical protein
LSDEEDESTSEDEEDENGPPSLKGANNQTVEGQVNPVNDEVNGNTEESSDEEEATFDDQEEVEEKKKEYVNKDIDDVSATTMNKEAPPHNTPSDNSQNVVQEMGEDDANDKPAGQPACDMEEQDSKCSDEGLDTPENATTAKDAKEEEEVPSPLMMEMESDPGPLLQTDENTEEITTPPVSDTRDSADPLALTDEDKNNDTQPISGDAS